MNAESEGNTMNILVNGHPKDFPEAHNLKNIIEQLCAQTSRVMAEVNGKIIRSPQWESTPLKDGDKIELVSFVGGG